MKHSALFFTLRACLYKSWEQLQFSFLRSISLITAPLYEVRIREEEEKYLAVEFRLFLGGSVEIQMRNVEILMQQ
jgi:hypothetical protein